MDPLEQLRLGRRRLGPVDDPRVRGAAQLFENDFCPVRGFRMAGTGIVVRRGWMPDYANGQTLFFLALRLRKVSLQFHQFTKACLQPLVDFPQPLKMAAPKKENRNGTGAKGNTPQDETEAPRPNSCHGQQRSVEHQESDREYGDRASRLRPSRSTWLCGAYP